MNIDTLFNTLASDNGRKFKEDLLSQHAHNVDLKRAVRLALDPTINYYIKQIPLDATISTAQITLSEAMDTLEHVLAKRVVTGDAARALLANTLASLTPEDAAVIARIIMRDLRCGVSESTANKVWKNIIPEYPYMRCSLTKHVDINKWDWAGGVFSQEKADGMFTNVNVYATDVGADVTFSSRSGSVFPNDAFASLEADVIATFNRNTQTHAEMLVKRDGVILPREIGNGILNSVLKGGAFADNETPVLLAWDQIPLSEATPGNKYRVPYKQRYANLLSQITCAKTDSGVTSISNIETRVVYSVEEALEHYAEMLAAGKEGTIIKEWSAIWEDTTSKKQVKFKLEVDLDLQIVGFTEGNGKNAATFGSITCISSDGLLEVNVSGFKDKKQKGIPTRQEIHNARDLLINTIMTVRSNNIMKPTKSNPKFSLFLPRFVEFRQDKVSADSLERILDQFESAIRPKGNK